MSITESGVTVEPRRAPPGRARLRAAVFGGGTSGNEQLTAMTGVLLVILLAVIGVTILRIRQLIWIHLFVGLLLIGPVALKMASTGYRFARYYTREPRYHAKGPPQLGLRMVAPVLVLSTVAVFVTGLLLLFGGAGSRNQYLELHKVSFIAWLVFAGLHVLGHLPGLPESMRLVKPTPELGQLSPGGGGRWLALVGAVVAGLVLAVILIPDFASWTHAAGGG